MENKKEIENGSNQTNKNGNAIGAIVSLIGIVVVLGIYFSSSTGSSKTDFKNTTWTSTDGYTLYIESNSCYLSKDGKKLNNVCNFTANSNNTGIGRLEICDASGLSCDDLDLTKKIHSNTDNYIMIYGRTFYLQ